MAATGGAIVDYVGAYFGGAAGSGAAGGLGTASAAAAATTEGSASYAALTTGAATVGTATTTTTGAGLAATAASAATAGSALYQLSQGSGHLNIPPAPQPAAQQDQQVAATEQADLRRAQAAGGLASTTGTAGGQAGSVLAPATLSNKSTLGG